MTEITWREVKRVDVQMNAGPLWRLALEFVQGPRLLRIRVLNSKGNPVLNADGKPEMNAGAADWPTWGKAGSICRPDGAPANPPRNVLLLCSQAPYGALIGKLGGSSADNPDTTPSSPPYGTKKVFAVGTYCVIAMTKDDSGPLFLTRNESLDAFKDDMGELKVLIEEASC
jgi:hypothetical protein